jgi:hypothetical protein
VAVKSGQLEPILKNLVRLRRASRRAEGPVGHELAAIEEDLVRLIGPTVRPADAARLLGISEPGLKRWLDSREIASVLTPAGRREIPLSELIELLDDVERARAEGIARPLAYVIRRRRREANDKIDIERLLPRSPSRTHREAELQGLAYHRLVAERLDRRMVERARRQLEQRKQAGRIDKRWASEWERILSGSLDEIREVVSADTPDSAELRQTSPFAGVLNEQERRLLTASVAARGTQ